MSLALASMRALRAAASMPRSTATLLRPLSTFPGDRKYAKSHEWAKLEGDIATVGITEHAQSELGEIVFVELPEKGALKAAGEGTAILESVKVAADVYSPLSGEVVDVNEKLEGAPELINQSAHDDGWMFKIKVSAANEYDAMMDGAAYEKSLED